MLFLPINETLNEKKQKKIQQNQNKKLFLNLKSFHQRKELTNKSKNLDLVDSALYSKTLKTNKSNMSKDSKQNTNKQKYLMSKYKRVESSSSIKLLECINSMLQNSNKQTKIPKEKLSSNIYSRESIQRSRVSKFDSLSKMRTQNDPSFKSKIIKGKKSVKVKNYDYCKPDSGSTSHRVVAIKPVNKLPNTKSMTDLLKKTKHHFKREEMVKINNLFN